MIDLRSKNSKVVLNFTLLSLDLLFQDVDVFLFVAQQKYKVIGKDIGMIGHEIAELWNLAAAHWNFWSRHVLSRIDWSIFLSLGW